MRPIATAHSRTKPDGPAHGEKHMSRQAQRTLGYPSAGATRRSFILAATAVAASSTAAQKLAHAAIVQTDTARLPPIPLPAGIRSRYVGT